MSSRLAYDVHGASTAPVVVLGSSLGTTRSMWDEQTAALAEEFRVVRYDHLGHGSSEVPQGPYSVPGMAEELVSLLDDLEIDRAHLAGLSLGGVVATQVAATRPARVDRLALVCTATRFPPARTWLQRAAVVRAEGMEAIADTVMQRWFTPTFAGSQRAEELRRDLLGTPAEGYAGCCEALAIVDQRPLLGGIQAPTLVVAGTDDPATPAERGREIVDGLRTPARLEVVGPAAHLASVEASDRVTALLLAHLTAEKESHGRG